VWRQSQEAKIKPWTRATMGDRQRYVEAPVHPPPNDPVAETGALANVAVSMEGYGKSNKPKFWGKQV